MEPEKLTLSLVDGRFTTSLLKAGSGEPLLYLHGALGPVGNWDPFLDRLAHDFTVYAPWFPGYGETKGIDHLEDITDLTLYHMELLDALGLSSTHIVWTLHRRHGSRRNRRPRPPPRQQARPRQPRRSLARRLLP